MPSQLHRLFESLTTEASLDALVQEKREEDLYLEFKQKADSRNGDLDVDDKKNFSKALSGFANADGGVLIFGVETKKSAEGVDRAASLKPITGHIRFRGRLLDSIINATQPVVDDVRIECIDANASSGYIKCLVPQSVKPPHRAVLADHLYWRRVSTGNRRMEHYELEDAFGRRPHPLLIASLVLKPRAGDDPHEEVNFSFRNDGRGIARFVGLMCEFSPDVQIVSTTHLFSNNTGLNNGRPIVSYENNTSVLHAVPISSAIGGVTIKRPGKSTPLAVSLRWYCDGMSVRSFSGTINPET